MTVKKSILIHILTNHKLLDDDDYIQSIKVGKKNVEVLGKSYDVSGEKAIHLNIPIAEFNENPNFKITEEREGFKTTLS